MKPELRMEVIASLRRLRDNPRASPETRKDALRIADNLEKMVAWAEAGSALDRARLSIRQELGGEAR